MKRTKLFIALLLFSNVIIGCSDYNGNNTHIYEGICLLITVASLETAFYFYQQYRTAENRNKALTDSMKNNTNYQMLYEKLRDKEVLAQLTKASPEPPVIPIEHNKLNNEQLFIFLSDTIRSEKLFLNPKFGRQTLVDRFQISSHRIGAAFAQGSHHKSLPDFIKDCRLEHACQLLRETKLSINDVMAASGFSKGSSFNHAFKEKYDLSPTEFREHLSK